MEFTTAFSHLTSHQPLPWQERLYREYFAIGDIPPACTLPTGLGKTSVIAIWLIALANKETMPRRLIYVVNRRTVVDQTTDELMRYRKAIASDPKLSVLKNHFDGLRISTLRGQFADNGDWCEDPSLPAVICGTVDMIGSRLLFSGYGIGRAKRPLHAGFLGQDSLLIHDEAHLEPAFQRLVETIEQQQWNTEPAVPWPKLKVMELTATSQSQDPFTLDAADYANKIVDQRMNARKRLHLHPLADAKKPAKALIERALSFKDSGKAILLFAQSVDAVLEIQDALRKAKLAVTSLTGTMRGQERDHLVQVKEHNDFVPSQTFSRFLPSPSKDATPGTVYLVCTSAGEVGINISADHLICDLTTFESMAQRFGRVNRFGVDRSGKRIDDCEVHVYYPTVWDDKNPLTVFRQRTLELLRQLQETGSVCPKALNELPVNERTAAFAPLPTILPATDMLFDSWALTTITAKLPGRPLVEGYLHGLADNELPETHLAWREDVHLLCKEEVDDRDRSELLLSYPLLPQELLREPSYRAIKHLEQLGNRHPEHNAWLVDDEGTVKQITLAWFTEKDNKERIYGMTVVLDPHSGGLNAGMLDGTSETANDVSQTADRCRSSDVEIVPPKFHEVFKILMATDDDGGDEEPQILRWFARRNTGEAKSTKPVLLKSHVSDVERRMVEILSGLSLGSEIEECLKIAASYHDHGKQRLIFQTMLGNKNATTTWWAKSGRKSNTRLAEKYRHEFGSLHELPAATELGITEDQRELVLHLIAAHHGRGRPHFPSDEVSDPAQPQSACDEVAKSVPQRFGRLQRKFGRWGLAYLESLLRAADWSASANPSPEGEVEE